MISLKVQTEDIGWRYTTSDIISKRQKHKHLYHVQAQTPARVKNSFTKHNTAI